jgi:hypothetical protein
MRLGDNPGSPICDQASIISYGGKDKLAEIAKLDFSTTELILQN